MVAANARSARRRGSARAWSRSLTRSSRSRATSCSGNVGVSMTSASRSSAGARFRRGTVTVPTVVSHPALAWIPAPRRSDASISAIASRRAVPSVSASAASTVSPACAASSLAAPPISNSCAASSGRPGRCETSTVSPFGSTVRANPGKWYGRGSPGTGRRSSTSRLPSACGRSSADASRLMPPAPLRRRPGRRSGRRCCRDGPRPASPAGSRARPRPGSAPAAR